MNKEKENTTNITFKYRCYPDKWMQEFIDNNSVAYNLIYNDCVYNQQNKENNFYKNHGLSNRLKELYNPKIIELDSIPKKLRHKDFDELFYNTCKESGCIFTYLDKKKEIDVVFSDSFNQEILKQIRFAIGISKRKIQNDLRIEFQEEYKKTYFTRKGEYNRVIESIKKYQEKKELDGKENLYKKHIENVYSGTINYVIDNMHECWQGVYKNHKGRPRRRNNIYNNVSFYKYQNIINPECVKNNIYRIGVSGSGKNKKYLVFIRHREILGELSSFKIKKDSLGHYYITLLCKLNTEQTESLKLKYPKTGLSCGIDIGRNYKATLTNINMDSRFYENTRNFTYLNLSKKYKDEKLNKILEYNNKEKTKNWTEDDFNKNKEKERVSKVLKKLEQTRSKIKNIKSRNYLDLTKRINKINENRRLKTKYENHQDSLEIVKNHDVIKMEDLNINSISSGKLATNKNINNVNLGEFRSMIEYKSKMYDRIFIKVDPKNTTKTCSNCGFINDIERGARLFICNSCGFEKDRDINASINILNSNNILIKKDKKKGKKVVDK